MTGAELAAALRCIADLVEGQACVSGLDLGVVLGGFTPSAEPLSDAERARRYRRRKRHSAVTPSVTPVTENVTPGVTNRDGSEVPPPALSLALPPQTPLSHSLSLPPPAAAAVTERHGASRSVTSRSVTVDRHEASRAVTDERVPCPADLALTEGQASSLELAPGIPREAQAVMRGEFVAAELGDPDKRMSLAQWRKCLSKAMCSRWSDPSRRPRKLEVVRDSEPPAEPQMHPRAVARLARFKAQQEADVARLAAEAEAKGIVPVRDLRKLTEGIGG